MGARFDDLILADYAESLAADAPRQRILQPRTNSGTGRYTMVGSAEGANVTLPGRTACGAWWTARY